MAARLENGGRQLDLGAAFGMPELVRRVDIIVPHVSLPDILTPDSLWRTKPDGRALVTNADTGMGAVFDPDTFFIEYDFFGSVPVSTHTFAAAIIALEDGHQAYDALTKSVDQVARRLYHRSLQQGRLFIIETAPSDDRIDWRRELLDQYDLVERAVTARDDAFLWRARRKKEPVRQARDYLAIYHGSEEYWRRNFFPDLLFQMAQQYEAIGFRVVDTDQIERALQHSRWIQRDIERLRNGFGIVVEAQCGCRWQIDLMGTVRRMLPTCESGCDGTPPLLPTRDESHGRSLLRHFAVGGNPVVLENHICRNCSMPGLTVHRVEYCQVLRAVGSDRTELLVERWCPSCGSPTTQKIVVRNQQIGEHEK